jgi:hypothetical protein
MLKKYQVLLQEWLEEHVKYLADRYGLSFSEMIRGQICISTLTAVRHIYPEYKPDITVEEILEMFKEQDKSVLSKDEMHRALSNIYFETRKAIEYWKDKDSERKKKN